jgi:site-specific DNA-methyltransferase (adenine-specific)
MTNAWNWTFGKFSGEQLSRYEEDEDGRPYKGENLTAERKTSSSGKFVWRGSIPGPTRGWAYTIDQLEAWWVEGRILTKRDGPPRLDGLKVYLDKLEGAKTQDIWADIPRIPNTSSERLGYDTQKPFALLERIIRASSNEGDVVLDPFCGCGTTIHGAQKLGGGVDRHRHHPSRDFIDRAAVQGCVSRRRFRGARDAQGS